LTRLFFAVVLFRKTGIAFIFFRLGFLRFFRSLSLNRLLFRWGFCNDVLLVFRSIVVLN
jgi:hypothetical protein